MFSGATDRSRALHALATASARRGFRIAYDLLGEVAEAEDAVQEALARACESFDRLRDPGALEGWFYRVLVNLCMRGLRRRRLGRIARATLWPGSRRDAAPDDGKPGLTGVEGPPAWVIEANRAPNAARVAELREVVRSLDALPGKQRTALVLRYGHELSVAEVAAMMGVGEGTVKTHLRRGLDRLRELLGSST